MRAEHLAELRRAARRRRHGRRPGRASRRYGSARQLYNFHVDNARRTEGNRHDTPNPACANPPPSTAPPSPRSSAPPRPASTTSAAAGAKRRVPHFDDLLFLGASMSRYPLEGYRERCDTDVVLGDRNASYPLHLDTPITIAGMSFGALSGRAKEALGRGASEVGTSHHHRRRRHDAGGARPVQAPRLPVPAVALRDEPRRPAQGRRHRDRARPGRQARRRRHAAGPEDHRAGRRDAHPADGRRPAQRRAGTPTGPGPDDLEIKIRELREITDWEKPVYVKIGATPHLLRREARGQGRRRRHRARRHAGRHRRDPGRVHRARRHPDAGRDPAGRAGAAGGWACTGRSS